jgi:hypothetical protein
LLPDQPPLATQLVALVAAQLSVLEPPVVTAAGFAVSVSDGTAATADIGTTAHCGSEL